MLLIYDASGSMWGQIEGQTKMEIAASVLESTVQQLPADQAIGLIAYGHRREADCNDVELIHDIGNRSREVVVNSIKQIKPLGRTPLALSATKAIDVLKKSQVKATIILITDGIESCNGDLCQVVQSAKEQGIEFKMHIVGFGLKNEDIKELECAAKAGNGQYFDASDRESLSQTLNTAVIDHVDQPESNFAVYAEKNKEALDVIVRVFESGTENQVGYQRSYRDTARLYLPSGEYDMKVIPLGGTDMSSHTRKIKVIEDQPGWEYVSFDGAKLSFDIKNNDELWDAIVKVYSQETEERVAYKRTYKKIGSVEVDPGNYYLTILALQIDGEHNFHRIDSISLAGGQSRNIQHQFSSGILKVGVQTDSGELIDAVVKVRDKSTSKTAASGRTYTTPGNNPKSFIMSPGSYTVSVLTLGKHKGSDGERDVTIKAGQEAKVSFQF